MKNKQTNKSLVGRTGKDLINLLESKEKSPVKLNPVSPVGDTEITLFAIWRNVLGHQNFDTQDDFFLVGGNSLKGIQLVSQISKVFLTGTQLTDIFLNPTIAGLSSIIQAQQKAPTVFPQMKVGPRPENIPLSYSQERVWFIDRLEGSIPYHVPAVLNLKGNLKIDFLEKALQYIVNRHEALRTIFPEKNGQACQFVTGKNNWRLTVVDGSKYSVNPGGLQKYIQDFIIKPFDLSQDSMLRAAIISLGEKDHVLVVTLHHIISDAWSLSILLREVMELYNSFEESRPTDLASIEIQYADYTLWQRLPSQAGISTNNLAYWKEKLQDIAPQQLPTDFVRPVKKSTNGAAALFFIDENLSRQLNELSNQQGTTLFMLLLAAFKVLLHRYSSQQDICVGTSIANRGRPEVEGLIGFFVNTLALRDQVNASDTFTQLLQQVKSTTLEAYQHQEVPFEKVVEAVVNERDTSRSPLFQTMLVMPNAPDVQQLRLGNVEASLAGFSHNTSKFDITFFIAETTNGLQGTVEYSTDLYHADTIKRMTAHFETLLSSVVTDPQQQIGLLPMLTKSEAQQLIKEFSNSKVVYPADKSITALFEEQVKRTPNATALIFEGQSLSYQQLNENANQLAHCLQSAGVRPGSLVPLYVERSGAMITGILGIMKCGAAYVPVDTDFPQERIRYMLEDTGATIIVSSKKSRTTLRTEVAAINIIAIDDEAVNNQPITNLLTKPSAEALAYVIYTSGSTGKPKGVMITHRNLADYYYGLKEHTRINESSSFALVSTIATDLGNTVIYASLLSGGALHVFSKESVSNADYLHKYFSEHAIDCLKIVPSHWKALCTEEQLLLPKKLLVFGGEALQSTQVASIQLSGTGCRIVNHYGPTETTIGKLLHEIKAENNYNNTIPIGKPFSNTRVYVLSTELQLCPVGVPGQLYIAGDGVSRGYLNNAELTKEKFIPNPFDKQEKGKAQETTTMYGTGDLVKWLPDGNIVFMGRIDDQVKIRGYRIELGEIETVLQQCALVSEAVVLARADKQGNKRLIAYIVPKEDFDREGIIGYLKEQLPDYMIPAVLISMESLPLTANGKVNRKALPDEDEQATKYAYTAPRDEVEKVLAIIWQDLLEVEQVGIHDNFFELGGDSIITIQLVSRARREGHELQVGDVFTYQTIARLAALLHQRLDLLPASTGEQFILTGASGLLPIQQWYLEKNPVEVSYFNQSVLLNIDKGITESMLKRSLEQLTAHHDALRFKYYKKEALWNQVYESEVSVLFTEELQLVPQDSLVTKLTEYAGLYQRSLVIEKGELMRVVLMKTPHTENTNRLLIVIHHLAVDGVSWRILLEDLAMLVTGLKNGGQTNLGNKTSSYRQWYTALVDYAQSNRLNVQKEYWEKTVKKYLPLPVDKPVDRPIKIKDTTLYTTTLPAAETKKLIQEVPGAYHTGIDDILLCALATTLTEWTGCNEVIIGMEGHGRENIDAGIDTIRTVGWFTTHYPVLLDLNNINQQDDLIKTVKEQLRRVPDKGLGFGVLTYINNNKILQASPSPDITFNYLGQVDNVLGADQLLSLSTAYSGADRSPEYIVNEKLSVNAIIQGGELMLHWTYSDHQYLKETILSIAQKFQQHLQSLITHCINQQKKSGPVFTPADYGLGNDISYQQLDGFLNETLNGSPRNASLESVYRLSGLQQGMLFHSLYDEGDGGIYMRQLGADLIGVDTEIFKRSWAAILKQHSVLRSGFYPGEFSIPVQCIYSDMVLPLELPDFSGMHEAEQSAAILQYEAENRAKSFDFKSPPLMRVGLIRLNESRHRMVWTWHHLLFDGWSMTILMEAFLTKYGMLSSGKEIIIAAEEDRFEDYIQYIERSDKNKAEAYWRNYLDGLEHATQLPFIKANSENDKRAGAYKVFTLAIDAPATTKMQRFAQAQRITVNTLMQGVWSYLLHRYTGNQNLCYGVVVSGRPDDMQGVEQRVGMYINTLPLHSNMKEDAGVVDWLQKIQNEQVLSRQFQYTPLNEIQGYTNITGNLFDSILVFENYPVSNLISPGKWNLGVEKVSIHEQNNYPLTITVSSAEKTTIGFSYNSALLEDVYIKKIAGHFERVLFQVINNPESLVMDISLLTPSEENELLVDFNNTTTDYPADKSIAYLFEQQAQSTPEAMAVVFEQEQLCYGELNERSNQLANYLIALGVKEQSMVPICIEKSVEMIVGILGILKAGAAYVPIDAAYPDERVQYMLDDIDYNVVLTSAAYYDLFADKIKNARILCLDKPDELLFTCSVDNLINTISPDHLAYIIYTSGSTGKPKGVMVTHGNVVSLVKGVDYVDLSKKDILLSTGSPSFDATTFEYWAMLLNGGQLILCTENKLLDSGLLKEEIENRKVTIMWFTAGWFNQLVDTDINIFNGLKTILVGGEKLSEPHIGKLRKTFPSLNILNGYGPTENTTFSLVYQFKEPAIQSPIPIGSPFGNRNAFVLDQQQRLVPVGVVGQIAVGGAGLSNGYLNNASLTKEKFITISFNKKISEKIYLTGDQGRWLPDGNIEYLGRVDQQVKIRGFRIELGEIETVLLQNEMINQAVVLAKEDKEGYKKLVGYVVTDGYFDKDEIVVYLKDKLPEYMIPALWVSMEKLPLTRNGKIDKDALPDPDKSDLSARQYVAPRNELEETLVVIWQDLLDLDLVGIEDNFFELGGDSIITIQLVSRVKQAGYQLQVADVFTHQTIAGLSAVIAQRMDTEFTLSAEQSLLKGFSGLLPIQQWYFEKENPAIAHFNQSVLLCIHKEITLPILQQAIAKIIAHHDALRFTYFQQAGQWMQEYGTYEGEVITEDLRLVSSGSTGGLITQRADEYQRSLHINKGELIRVVWMQTTDEEIQNRLLIVIHHLAVDGVSWRILLEDLEKLINGLTTGITISLGSKSTSYRQWYHALESYGNTSNLLAQLPYWQQVVKKYTPLPVDKIIEGSVLVKDRKRCTVKLSDTQTRRLLQEVPKAYHTSVNDILLAALAQTVCNCWGIDGIMIGLEGHGRESIEEGIDTNRTVGWFTSLFPVLLQIETKNGEADLIKTVKEQLNAIPDKGLGYGVLKYIKQEPSLQGASPWDIVFNYLGQLDNTIKESKWLQLAGESAGDSFSGELSVTEKFSVNAFVQSGQLVVNFTYSNRQYTGGTVATLVENYLTNLQKLIGHCLQQQASGIKIFTPSDSGLGPAITYKELDHFIAGINNKYQSKSNPIESIYRLSGLQQGMLFHSLYDDASGAYMVQFGCDLIATNLDFFKKSWDQVINKHSILRSAFYHDELSIPVQCVFSEVVLPIEILDYRDKNETAQEAAIKEYEYKDRYKSFDFKTAPLMRIGLLRLADSRYRMLWTSHHILFDGWSLPILMEEFLTAYESLAEGKQLSPGKADRFEDYIRYLENRNKEKEKLYWQKYLTGFETNTLLPFIASTAERNKGVGEYHSVYLQVNSDATANINRFAQANHITVNTIIQGVWAFLLHGYTGNNNIVYGVTVSGRPDGLTDVEQRVGMFINTVPLHSIMQDGKSIGAWLKGLQEEQVNSRQYQHTPLQDIKGWTGIQGDFFDSIIVFENYPVSKIIAAKQWRLQVEKVQTTEQTNYPLSIIVGSAEEINIRFSYNSHLLEEGYVNEIRGHFEQVLFQLINTAATRISDIRLLTAAEENQLLAEFNNTKMDFPANQGFINLFEAQVMDKPDNTALVFEEEYISYNQLNERANQLAHFLLTRGVTTESLIPICIERSPAMIVAILGILKSGAAYVPMDPAYPAERISYMLDDTAAAIVISSSQSRVKINASSEVEIIEIDGGWNIISRQPTTNLPTIVTPHQLAYVIYTSGSTGKPKGVLLEHGNLYSFICWCRHEFSSSRFDIVYASTSVCFDLSIFEIFYPLSIGKPLRIIENGLRIGDYLPTDSNVLTNTVPVVIQHLLQEVIALNNISVLNMAGEPIPAFVQQNLDTENIEVRNLYGPTEDTTYSTLFRLIKNKKVLIGKPIANTTVQIVNNKGGLVPIGVPGEIYLGGSGLARGYLNRTELTAEKFITPNFNNKTDKRFYKTGDIGRWLPDGNIEYLGRIDDQVKVRGFRIELGEIETMLLQSGMVRKAAVVVKEDTQGNKRLVAYVVAEGAFNKESISDWLYSKLPEHMVPAIWVPMENMPLTPNGKVDRKSLPDPDANELSTNKYIAPGNNIETALAEIWQKVLGKERVGMEDNFFELGGDSILTIQVVSRARRMGYELQPKDIFIHQTIGRLSKAIENRSVEVVTGEQGFLSGQSGLLPIQQWYFEREQPSVDHFNQAVIVSIDKMVTASEIGTVFSLLIERHDVLRCRYYKEKSQWLQEYGSNKTNLVAQDLQLISPDLLGAAITEIANAQHQSLHIATGELVRMVWIQTPASIIKNRLLIVVHHLAIDGVSWRILLEDIELLLGEIKEGGNNSLGHKSSSYRQWYHALENYGMGKALLSQLTYWQRVVKSYDALPVDKSYTKPITIQDMAAQVVTLDGEQTLLLLQQVPRVYHTEINDILLAALAGAVTDWSKKNAVTIGLEGHGREDIAAQIDTSRTIGWFTSLYPLLLTVSKNMEPGELIKSVKEQLRQVPDKGLGYGVLKYINKEISLRGTEPWDIIFNYLGQLDNVFAESNWLAAADESTGTGRSKEQIISEKLSVSALVKEGRLVINCSYSTRHYESGTIQSLMENYLSNLQQLITHCIMRQKTGLVYTPSDYGLGSDISYEELDKFLEDEDADNIISF